MARMTGFIFQDEYLERLAKLSDQELGRLVRALAVYHATGETQELAGRESIAYDFIRYDIDRIDQSYEAKCQTNKNNRQRPSTTDNDRQRPSTTVNEQRPNPTTVHKDKDKVKDNIYITTTPTAHVREGFDDITVDPLIIKLQQELNGLTDTHYQALDGYRRELGDELVSFAIDEAVGNGVRNWSYVEKILRRFVQTGIMTVGEAKAKSVKQSASKPAKVVSAQQYQQREYDEEEMEHLIGVADLFGGAAS